METPNDLVQIDIETALALYVKGYTHIPVLKRDMFSSDWSSMQPLYLDDILEGLMCFASDSKRAELLNPPKVDIAKVKESIYLDAPLDDDDDEDDDPDWTEEEEPDNFIQLEEADRVKIPYEKPQVIEEPPKVEEKPPLTASGLSEPKPPLFANAEAVDARIKAMEAGDATPAVWNVKEAIKLHDKEGVSYNKLGKFYGVSDMTVKNRIVHYKMK